MAKIETIEVALIKTGKPLIINKKDFDAALHVPWDEFKQAKKQAPAKEK